MNEQLQSIIRLPVEIGDTDMFDLILKSNSITDEEKHDILIYSILNSTEPDFVQHVLDSGLNESLLNESDDGSTLLHYAAASDSEEILKLFLKKDKSLITSKNGDGFTPLMISAIKTNNVDVIKTLIKAGSDINCLTNTGANIFILACGTNPNVEIIKYIHGLGFDIESTDDNGFTPLLTAAFNSSNEDVLCYLTSEGANINAKTNSGENLFHLAAHNSCLSVVRYISSAFNSYDTSEDGTTCLENALYYANNPDVLHIYLKKNKFETVLRACHNENPYILEALFNSGYEINMIDEDQMTPLMYACKINSNPEIVKMFKANGAIMNAKDRNGRNALHYAAVNTNPAIYDFLCKAEPDLKERDNSGNTPDFYLEHTEDF